MDNKKLNELYDEMRHAYVFAFSYYRQVCDLFRTGADIDPAFIDDVNFSIDRYYRLRREYYNNGGTRHMYYMNIEILPVAIHLSDTSIICDYFRAGRFPGRKD